METKKCCNCKKEKSLSAFNKDRTSSDGFQGVCKECRREIQRRWVHKKKKELYNKPCVVCGLNPAAQGQYHHLESDKKEFDIGGMVHTHGRGDIIQTELEKCVLMCKACHALVETLIVNPDVIKYVESAKLWASRTIRGVGYETDN